MSLVVEITSVEQALAMSEQSAWTTPGLEMNEPKIRMLGKAWDEYEDGDDGWLVTKGHEFACADALGRYGQLDVEDVTGADGKQRRRYRLSDIQLALNGLVRS